MGAVQVHEPVRLQPGDPARIVDALLAVPTTGRNEAFLTRHVALLLGTSPALVMQFIRTLADGGHGVEIRPPYLGAPVTYVFVDRALLAHESGRPAKEA
jgi:hypothetical protein